MTRTGTRAVPHYPILILLYVVHRTVSAPHLRLQRRGAPYPPFTLPSRPGYPGDLEVDYPEQLTNWAVLVKWWLLAIPQIFLCWAMEPLPIGIVRWHYRALMRD